MILYTFQGVLEVENRVYANVNIKTFIFLPVATANDYIIKL